MSVARMAGGGALAVSALAGGVGVLQNSNPASSAATTSPAAVELPVQEITTKKALPRNDQLVFESLLEMHPSGSTKLVNGDVVINLTAWSAVGIARRAGGGNCSATVIGPRVLLTAAHCIDRGFGAPDEVAKGYLLIGNDRYDLSDCEMHPEYVKAERLAINLPRNSFDYALCELNGAPPVIYETIDMAAGVPPGGKLLMMGYGCTKVSVVANELLFEFRAGDKRDTLRLGDGQVEAVRTADFSPAKGLYYRTRSIGQEPVLCEGDSGGPALSGATLAQQKNPQRRVAAINSKVTAVPAQGGYQYLSFMASLAEPQFAFFLAQWKGRNASVRRVCGSGLQPGESNCRG